MTESKQSLNQMTVGYYQGYNTLGVQYRAYVKDQSLWLQQIPLSHYSVLRKRTVHSCVRMPLHTLYTHNYPHHPLTCHTLMRLAANFYTNCYTMYTKDVASFF